MMCDIFNKQQSQLSFLLTIVYLIIGSLCGLILYHLFSAYYFSLYFVIVLFFWSTGIITNYIVERTIRYKANRLLSVYMMLRLVKFLLIVIFLAMFEVFIMDENHKIPFAVALMGNYFLYACFELYIFNLYNKRFVNNEKKE